MTYMIDRALAAGRPLATLQAVGMSSTTIDASGLSYNDRFRRTLSLTGHSGKGFSWLATAPTRTHSNVRYPVVTALKRPFRSVRIGSGSLD
jgi:hypothetical protein